MHSFNYTKQPIGLMPLSSTNISQEFENNYEQNQKIIHQLLSPYNANKYWYVCEV